jgi:hypothetical protein
MWFTSTRSGSASCDIYRTTRADRTSAWGTPVLDTALSTAGCDADPALSDDGLAMALSSGSSGDLVYLATRASTGSAFSNLAPLAEVNTEYAQHPGALRDGQRSLFLDQCTDISTCGIFVATRTSVAEPFGAPVRVDTVNLSTDNGDVWVSRDRRTMYFSSDVTGDMEIYEATR